MAGSYDYCTDNMDMAPGDICNVTCDNGYYVTGDMPECKHMPAGFFSTGDPNCLLCTFCSSECCENCPSGFDGDGCSMFECAWNSFESQCVKQQVS